MSFPAPAASSTPSTSTSNPLAARRRAPKLGLNGERLFTASDVAEICQVDLKTIHNWTEASKLTGFRTPGRHLRFKAADVRAFLELHGYPLPAAVVEATTPAKPMMTLPVELGEWALAQLRDVGRADLPGALELDEYVRAARGAAS